MGAKSPPMGQPAVGGGRGERGRPPPYGARVEEEGDENKDSESLRVSDFLSKWKIKGKN